MRRSTTGLGGRARAALLAIQLLTAVGACAGAREQPPLPEAAPLDAPVVAPQPEQDPDLTCLRQLDERAVAYKRAPAAGGMRTPIEVTGPFGALALVPRGRRAAVMDCMLAVALARSADVFQELGITALAFSAAFDNRTRRGSTEPSGHAYGLAIDVHAIRGTFGEYDVRKQFERGVGLWRGLGRDAGALEACIGQPTTNEGRLLRRLACRLKLHPAYRVIVTPDDDADHQDHLHLEARAPFFPPRPNDPPLPQAPAAAASTASLPQEKPAAAPAPSRRAVTKRKRKAPAKHKKPAKKKKETMKSKNPGRASHTPRGFGANRPRVLFFQPPARNARSYITGRTTSVSSAADNVPPTMTTAMGRCVSEPMARLVAAGTSPRAASAPVIKTGAQTFHAATHDGLLARQAAAPRVVDRRQHQHAVQ